MTEGNKERLALVLWKAKTKKGIRHSEILTINEDINLKLSRELG